MKVSYSQARQVHLSLPETLREDPLLHSSTPTLGAVPHMACLWTGAQACCSGCLPPNHLQNENEPKWKGNGVGEPQLR